MPSSATRDPVALIPRSPVRPILLTGASGFLGGHFLLRRIEWPGEIYAIVRGESVEQARARVYAHLADCAAAYGEALPTAQLDARLRLLTGDITQSLCGLDAQSLERLRGVGIAEIWHCAASLKFEDRHRKEIIEHNVGGTGNMLALFEELSAGAPADAAPQFVHISTAYSAGQAQGRILEERNSPDRRYNNVYEESKNAAENKVVDFCEARDLGFRILRPTIVMGPKASHHSGTTRFGVYGFAKEVRRLRETLVNLQQRLELEGDPKATANLTPVDECVADMLQLSAVGFGAQRYFHLSNPEGVSMARLIAMIDDMAGVDRLSYVSQKSADRGPLQKLFDRRTRFYSGYYNADKHFVRDAPPQSQVDWDDVEQYLRSFFRELDQEAAGGVGFRTQTVRVRDGAPLKVFSCGNPTLSPLFLANAYGMPAEFMWPLAQRLQNDFHVVTWECRWVPTLGIAFDPAHCDSQAHARDLVDIQQALGLGVVGVAGWSSGAQVALNAMANFPDRIRAGVLLNPGVSIRPSDSVRVTRFEVGIRSLFDKIAGNRRMAEKYCELIYGASGADASDTKMLSSILTSTDPYLLYMTSLPFRTGESLFRYANMMRTLFSEREDAWTHEVTQPVVVHVAGNDEVTHPDVGQALCDGLADGELHFDPEGDHFGHYYDQRVADLIRVHLGERQAMAA